MTEEWLIPSKYLVAFVNPMLVRFSIDPPKVATVVWNVEEATHFFNATCFDEFPTTIQVR